TEAERHRLLVEWAGTRRDYPSRKSIQALFEEQVERAPDAVAIVCDGEQLTYRELNEQANQLAHFLQRRGVGPETRVGVCLERSPEMIAALLGILKAGGAYVPLDCGYPPARLAFMIEDAALPVLLTQEKLARKLPASAAQLICLDAQREEITSASGANPQVAITADNLAYVRYTSGSTGQPKGVAVVHRNVVRLVKNTNYVTLTPREVLLQFAPISFDASTFEIWGSLLNGAHLVLMSPGTPSLAELG